MISIKWIIFLLGILFIQVLSRSCLEEKKRQEKYCEKNDYDNYLECVKTRMKRHSNRCSPDRNCYQCDCNTCQYNLCKGECNNCCNLCCNDFVQCHTYHCCHKQCHAECRTSSCRSDCRKSCYETMQQKTPQSSPIHSTTYFHYGGVIQPRIINNDRRSESTIDQTQIQKTNVTNRNIHNITTVINLKNFLNNTNLIDIPIRLNYTNRNNISLPGDGNIVLDNCCIVIGPRQCVPTPNYPFSKCYHTRSRQCGVFCLLDNTITHQKRSNCNNFNGFDQPPGCDFPSATNQQQQKCIHISRWPYIMCNNENDLCAGCYKSQIHSQQPPMQSQTCPIQCLNDVNVQKEMYQLQGFPPGLPPLPACYYSSYGCGYFNRERNNDGGIPYVAPQLFPNTIPVLTPSFVAPDKHDAAMNSTKQVDRASTLSTLLPISLNYSDMQFSYPLYPSSMKREIKKYRKNKGKNA